MKQTILKGEKAYIQEIKGKDIAEILTYIERQTKMHLDTDLAGDENMTEAKRQLEQLLEAIHNSQITDASFDSYLTLWQPQVVPLSDGKKEVILTLYDDGTNKVFACLPHDIFEIYEY